MRMPSFFGLLSLLFMATASLAADQTEPFAPQRESLSLKAVATINWLSFIEVYKAALYAPASAKASEILAPDSAFFLEIVYSTSLTKAQLIEAAQQTLSQQHTSATRARYQEDVAALHDHYRDVSPGDRFRLEVLPEAGLALFFNDKLLYRNKDSAFARYYLGLWLAEKPLSPSLRDRLLDW